MPGALPEAEIVRRSSWGPTVVFVGAGTFQKAVPFLLLPFVSSALGTSGYGQLSVWVAVGGLLNVGFGLGLDAAAFRAYFNPKEDREQRAAAVQSIWRFSLAASLSIAAVMTAVVLAGSLFSGFRWELPVLTFWWSALTVSASVLPQAILRATERLGAFVVSVGVTTLATNGLVVGLVVVGTAGPAGWLAASALGSSAGLVTVLLLVPFRRRVPFRRDAVREALRIGLPLVPHFAAAWALQAADRMVLAGVTSDDDVGVYALASNLASVVLILVVGLNQAMMPYYAAAQADPGSTEHVRQIRRHVVTTATLGVLAIATLPLVLDLVATDDFSAGVRMVGPIALGYLLMGLYFVPMNSLSLTFGKTRGVWIVTLASSGLNLTLVALLVPGAGVQAAAWATVVGYAALLLGTAMLARRRGALPSREALPTVSLCVALAGAGGAIAAVEAGNLALALTIGIASGVSAAAAQSFPRSVSRRINGV